MKKAKIIYNREEDSFEIHIDTGDGWGFSTGYRCFAKDTGGEANFISWTVLRKLSELQQLGYEIDFGGV